MQRALTLAAPPGPATATAALSEACAVFDSVMAGTWQWPDPDATPAAGDESHLQAQHLERLSEQLRSQLVGERMAPRTWDRTWAPYLRRLQGTAAERRWANDPALLESYLRNWSPSSRARQMAYDRARRLWKEAGWPWPEELAHLRGNGKAAADPEGVQSFSDQEIQQLREAIEASKLTPADLVAWDCLAVFGLRPQELIGLELKKGPGGVLLAVVTRSKVSSKGATRPRQVPAVPPSDWPANCHRLLERFWEHGLPSWSQTVASPGEHMTQQLRPAPCVRPATGPGPGAACSGGRRPYGAQPCGASEHLRPPPGRARPAGKGARAGESSIRWLIDIPVCICDLTGNGTEKKKRSIPMPTY